MTTKKNVLSVTEQIRRLASGSSSGDKSRDDEAQTGPTSGGSLPNCFKETGKFFLLFLCHVGISVLPMSGSCYEMRSSVNGHKTKPVHRIESLEIAMSCLFHQSPSSHISTRFRMGNGKSSRSMTDWETTTLFNIRRFDNLTKEAF